MEFSDEYFSTNCDWDPCYLAMLFEEEFNDFSLLWISEISDVELITEGSKMDVYCPIVEDISIEDDVLCSAVEKIEEK